MTGPKLSDFLLDRGVEFSPRSRIVQGRKRQGVSSTAELERILHLPRRVLDLGRVEDLTPRFLRPDASCPGCSLCLRRGERVPVRLHPIQSAALAEIESQRGLFGSLPVGAGKTLVAALAPRVLRARRPVYLVPPSLRAQLEDVMLPEIARHFEIERGSLTVVPYSLLSDADAGDVLARLAPDVILADEMHRLARKVSSRSRRFLRYMAEHPECAFVGLSGSVTQKSLMEYAHLLELALKKGSPLPNRWRELKEWAAVLDAKPDPEAQPGALLEFCAPGETPRQGYSRRLAETAGVVMVDGEGAGMSLLVRARCPRVPLVVAEALEEVQSRWEIDGNEIADATEMWRILRQLSSGFYLRWDWAAARRRAGLPPSAEPDLEWLGARNAWNRAVRKYLTYSAREGMDSPLLLARAATDGRWCCEAWEPWARIRRRYALEPPTVAVWISDFLVEDAAAWARDLGDEGGVIWTAHPHLGARLEERGIPFFGAGADAALGAFDPEGRKVLAASIQAHGEGKNLQRYARAYVLNPPQSGRTWEQLLGRLHRQGQVADEVVYDVALQTAPLAASLREALREAEYARDTLGQRQRLLAATRIGIG